MSRKIFKRLLLGWFLFCVSLFFSISNVDATIRHVPSVYATIQAACDAASEGDTIQVAAGTYVEQVTVNTAGLTIQGAGASSTTINPGSKVYAISIGNDNIKIDGFTIQVMNKGSQDMIIQIGVFGGSNRSNIIISNNIIKGDGALVEYAIGTAVTSLNLTISSNTISDINSYGIGIKTQNSTINSNTLTGAEPGPYGIILLTDGGGSNTVSNNTVSGFSKHEGISVTPGNDNTTVYGNTVSNCATGIGVYSSSSVSVYNNLIYDITGYTGTNTGLGIQFVAASGNMDSNTAINNTIVNVHDQTTGAGLGILASGGKTASNNTLLNNIVVNSDLGILIAVQGGTVTGTTANYNDVYNNSVNYYGVTAGANDLPQDPKFVSDSDYHLQSTSPCIDAGTSSSAPSTDIDGTSRPQGGGYDMGCYEASYTPTGTLSAGSNQPASASVDNDATNVLMMQLHINGDSYNNTTVTSVTFTASGTGDDSTAISTVKLYKDVNSDGSLDSGDTQIGTNQTYSADNGTVTFSSLSESIAQNGSVDWLLLYDLAGTALEGETFSVSLANSSDITITGSSVDVTGAPVSGRTITIEGEEIPTTTITGTVYDSSTNASITGPITSLYYSGGTLASNITSNPFSFTVNTGDQVYIIVEKEGYTFPSNNISTKVTGDHGELFTATGSSMTIDIPLDPGYPIELTKTANKKEAVVGDIITYNVKLRNKSTLALSNIILVDEIVNGFKYVNGSTYIGSTRQSDPTSSSRSKTFTIGTINGSSTINLSYQVRVGTGIVPGSYKSTGVAKNTTRNWQMSNQGSCKVDIIKDPLFDLGTIIGKVYIDKNANQWQDKGEPGVPGVRIATEYGVVVTTDRDGKYHIAGVEPGRHLLKVDPNSLPKWIEGFTTDNPYTVKITSGLLAKVNFGIAGTGEEILPIVEAEGLSNISITEETGLFKPEIDIALNEPAPGSYEFHISTNYGLYITKWQIIIKDSTGETVKQITGDGAPPALINWDGKLNNGNPISKEELYMYCIEVEDSVGKKDRTELKELRPEGSVLKYNFRPRGKTYYGTDTEAEEQIYITGANLVRVSGKTYPEKMVKIKVDGAIQEVESDSSGEFNQEILMDPGTHRVEIETEAPGGKKSVITRDIEIKENYFFLVALGEGELRDLDTSGNIEMVEEDDTFDDGLRLDGKLALYLRGKIKGKYLITGSVDTRRYKGGKGYGYIDKEKLMTNLDPDKYYPIYGDASIIDNTANDTQDQVYLLVEWDRSHAKWGSFHTGFDDTDLAVYTRTLHGGSVAYESVGKTKFGDPWTKIKAFYAKALQLAAHDEFLGTGGSLYYLRYDDIVEGSEKIKVQLRDRQTNIVLSEYELREEIDYEIDYEQGRILLRKPLGSSSYAYQSSIISNDILGGPRVYLVVDYEYHPSDSMRKEAWGVKASQQLGPYIRVGGGYVDEDKDSEHYKLASVDGTLKLNEKTEITGEYARSEETQMGGAYSIDGGLTFDEISSSASDNHSGNAWMVKGKTQLFSNTDIQGYFVRRGEYFSASNILTDDSIRKYGASITTRLTEGLVLGIKHATQDLLDTASTITSNIGGGIEKSHITTALLDYTPGKLDIRAEYQHQDIDGELVDFSYIGLRQINDNDFLAARIGYQLTERFHPYVGGQGTLSGPSNNQGFIGADIRLFRDTYINVKETVGNLGNSTLLGLTSQITEDTSAYSNIEIGNNAQTGRFTKTTWGQVTQMDRTSKVYTEQDYNSYQENILRGNIIGYDKKITDNLGFGLSYERSSIEKEPTAISRDAGSATLSYLNIDWLELFSKLEIRDDRDTANIRQWLTQNKLIWYLTKDISLLGRFNWSRSRDETNDNTQAKFHEVGAGLAYRPVNFDRLNLLAKYGYITDLGPESQNDFSETTESRKHIYAIEGAFDLCRYLQLVGKYALRDMDEKVGPRDWTDSATNLYIARTNFHIMNAEKDRPFILRGWDLGLEYRVLHNPDSDDKRYGWLVELDKDIGNYIRCGVGYNFTDFDDDLSNDDDWDAKGWFVRLVGKY